MPPRNTPLPSSLRLFNCAICDKGYPRQLDYENHLGSYDHNHRQRLADLKKLTASNDPESAKPKQGLDMRSINVEEAGKKISSGGRFTKIGGAAAGGGRFKKVGIAVGDKKDEVVAKSDGALAAEEKSARVEVILETREEKKVDAETVMAKVEENEVTWEEYDFSKPTGCDHPTCSGLKTDGIWSGEWMTLGKASS